MKNSLISIVRCWNKSKEDLEGLFSRLKTVSQRVPQLRAVFISVNGDKDQNDQTIKNLEGLLEEKDIENQLDIKIIGLKLKNYSWTAGLNAPIALLDKLIEKQNFDSGNTYILNQSFDVEFKTSDLRRLKERIENDLPIATRRVKTFSKNKSTDSDVAQFRFALESIFEKGTIEPSIDEFIDKNHEIVNLIRNTGMVFSLKELVLLKGFSSRQNSVGGMEDHEFFIRLMFYLLKKAKEEKDSEVASQYYQRFDQMLAAFGNPIEYKDLRWSAMDKQERRDKINNEKEALKFVFNSLSKEEIFVTPEEYRDFVMA